MKLADYVDLNPRTTLPRGRKVPYVGMEAVTPGRRAVVARESRDAVGSGSKFQPGDTLFARITPCLENGKIGQYMGPEAGIGSTEFFVLRAKPQRADPDYVFYFVCQPHIRAVAEKSMSGASGRQRAQLSALADLSCQFPALAVQRKVAETLVTFDDLIENHLRRAKLLEKAAQALFRGLFLDFTVAVNPDFELIQSRRGRVPRGWQVKRASECMIVNPSVPVPRGGEKPFVPMSSISEDSMLIDDFEMRSGNSGAKFQNGDTLFARITPCLENGKTGFVQFLAEPESVAFGSTEFIVLRSRCLTPEFVYLLARSQPFREHAIKSMSGASGRQRVRDACFDDFMVACPPVEVLRRFSEQVQPMFALIQRLHRAAGNLQKTRNLLVPELLSGKGPRLAREVLA